MNEARLLSKLKDMQSSYALESLRKPGDGSQFEYGKRVGYVAGVEAAISALLTTIADERKGEDL